MVPGAVQITVTVLPVEGENVPEPAVMLQANKEPEAEVVAV
jgi:hypothetical protein